MNKTDSDKLLEACGQAANAVIGAWSRGASYEGCRDCVLSAILAFLPDERRHADALETVALIEELTSIHIRHWDDGIVTIHVLRDGQELCIDAATLLDCLRQAAIEKGTNDA